MIRKKESTLSVKLEDPWTIRRLSLPLCLNSRIYDEQMTNPRGDSLPKGDVVVDENFFVSTICEMALLSIPEVCPDVVGYVASLYVDYLIHGWLRWMRLTIASLFKERVD
jgi:hypothetical protein